MPNHIFEILVKGQVDIFLNAFKTSTEVFYDEKAHNHVFHSGEYGKYREEICKDFLRLFIPGRFDIDQGFIITATDKISTQCDIIIYDSNSTPLIQSGNKKKFFPIETVVSVGEVKSTLSKSQFEDALNKLARVKMLREDIIDPMFIQRDFKSPYNPKEIPQDHIFSFLICQKLDFRLDDDMCSSINDMYEKEIEYHNRHNLILSLEDGLILYNFKVDAIMDSPTLKEHKLENRFVRIKENNIYHHIKIFAKNLFGATSQATIIFPEMIEYMEGFNIIRSL